MKNPVANMSKLNIVICLLVSGFISLLQVLGRYLDVRDKGLNVSLVRMGLEGIIFFILCNVMLVLLWRISQISIASKPLGKPVFSRLWFWQLIILLSWLPCYLAYFPGIYSYDGEPQLIQYTSGQLDNHHPILHTYIIGGCYDLGQWLKHKGINLDGLAFYTTLQCLLLSFAFAYLLRFLVKQKSGAVYIILSAVYICFFPTMPLMAVSSTKDTFFAAFFVLFLTELAHFNLLRDSAKNGILLRLFVFALGCMFFRRNGYYILIILTVICLLCTIVEFLKKTPGKNSVNENDSFSFKSYIFKNTLCRLTVILLISVIVFNVSEKVIIKCSNALEGESAEALSIPLQQMARAYKSSDAAVRDKYGERLSEYISETGLSNYRPLITDGVKQYFNNEHFGTNKSDFIKLYVDMGIDYPGPYVLAVLYLTKGDWHILDTSFCNVYKDWWRDRTGYLITDATPVFALDYVHKENLLPFVRDMYESFATDCSFMSFIPLQILCAPALYVFLVVLGALALFIRKKRVFYPVIGALLLYMLTMLAGPCVLVRYVFPIMSSIPLLAWCVIIKPTIEDHN